MALVRNFKVSTDVNNTLALNWDMPLGFNNENSELIVTRTITHFPMELYNKDFPNTATDSRPIEIFRGNTITGVGQAYDNTNSVQFTANNQVLLVPNAPEIEFDGFTDAFSVSFWTKAANISDYLVWLSTRSNNTGYGGWEVTRSFTSDISFIIHSSGGTNGRIEVRTIDQPLAGKDGQWIHVAVTYDGSASGANVKIYINGVAASVQNTINTLTGSASDGRDLGIGSRPLIQNTTIGFMDEVAIYNAELTATQISEIYNSGVPRNLFALSSSTKLAAWWRMGEGDTYPTISDAVNSNDGTMTNMSAANIVTDVISPNLNNKELFDPTASLPTNPPLNGRLLRDSNSKVFRILANTSTTITLDGVPATGKYVILPDFPDEVRAQENYEFDIRTTAGPGYIKNLVVLNSGVLQVKNFTPGELANLIFMDANGDKFIVKDNTEDTVYFFDSSATPKIGVGMTMLNSFSEGRPLPYIDNFRTEAEADLRKGSKLLNNTFYYYTVFSKPITGTIAQAEFATTDSGVSTQGYGISTDDTKMRELLYSLWPTLDRELDTTGDLQDLMNVFGFQFNEIYALVDTYNLQDPDKVLVTALLPLSEQTGLPSVGFSIGAHTLRRIARDMISCWKLKGSKEGIALFIRIITTWDVTNGTADYSSAIQDFLPNVEALRFFDPNLGSLNTRLTQTDPFVGGGRFAKSLPGVVIPGFFTFREFVVDLPNVALYVGNSEGFTSAPGTTTMIDTSNNFGADDSLVGNFLLPNTEEVNDIFEIVANTATTITVRGTINNKTPGGDYAVLSPLNTNRFQILNKLLPVYIPFGTRAGFRFIKI